MANVQDTDLAATGPGQGAAMVGFQAIGTGSVARKVDKKLGDVLSVTDFGAKGDGVTDDTGALQAALNRAGVLRCDLFLPATGTFYKIISKLDVPDGVRVYGAGHIKQTARGQNLFSAGHDNTFDGLRLEGDGLTGTGVLDGQSIAIYAVGKRHLKVTNCVIHGHEGGGVFARNCFGVYVEGNLLYGNNWSGTAGGGSPSVADVSIYSNAGGGGRFLIRGNQLYSNNSQNIFFSAVGLDQDAIIEGNICNTLDASFAEVTNGGVKRHSIIAGYVNSQERRLIVRGNICRNTKQTGIYAYSSSTNVTGPVLIEGNLCSNIGYDATVSDLVGAVLVAPYGECPMIVRGNYSVDFKHTQGAAFTQVSGRAMIEGNVSVRSASRAVAAILNVDCAIVRGNFFRTSAGIDIWVELVNTNIHDGGIVIEGNDVKRTTVSAMIRSILGTGYQGRCTIRDNQLKGAGANNDDANIGIIIQAPLDKHDIVGNRISDVKWGVNAYNYLPVLPVLPVIKRYHSEMRWDRNTFENCGTGGTGAAWGVGATSTAAIMPVEGNTYVNCTARHSGGTLVGWVATCDAQREGEALEAYGFSAKPTVGTWLAGDRVRFTAPAAGGSPGANCTAGGNPGTWKHWATLEA